MAAGVLLSILGLGVLCALMYQAAVYALPAFVGLAVGLWAFDSGAGVVGAMVVGVVVAIVTLAVARFCFGGTRSALGRAAVASIYAMPAALAGYHVVLGLAHYSVPSDTWRHVFAVLGAAVIACTAVARLVVSHGAVRDERGV